MKGQEITSVSDRNANKILADYDNRIKAHLPVAEFLADVSMLPPKIGRVLNIVEINSKAAQLQAKYLDKPTDMRSPMSIAVKTWGPVAIADFLKHRDAVRYIYSPTNNTAQCIRARLGDPNKPEEAAMMKCWLCNFPLINPRTGTAYDTIACEHVLPVYQAVMYADIALAKRPSTSTEELVASEYGWAHAVCNGPKSNKLFIVEVKDRSDKITGWKIDDNTIKQTLKETIPGIMSKGIDNGTLGNKEADELWVDKCLKAIKVRLNVILSFLEHSDPGAYRMSYLFSVSKLIDPERLASNVKLDQAAYDAYAEQLESDYDQYMDTLLRDTFRDPHILDYYPRVYNELGQQEWKLQRGRGRTKRKRAVTRKRKNKKRK
jgi:hypothetical protein